MIDVLCNCKAALWCNVAFHVLTTTPDGPVCRAASPELQRQELSSDCRVGEAKLQAVYFCSTQVPLQRRFSKDQSLKRSPEVQSQAWRRPRTSERYPKTTGPKTCRRPNGQTGPHSRGFSGQRKAPLPCSVVAAAHRSVPAPAVPAPAVPVQAAVGELASDCTKARSGSFGLAPTAFPFA